MLPIILAVCALDLRPLDLDDHGRIILMPERRRPLAADVLKLRKSG